MAYTPNEARAFRQRSKPGGDVLIVNGTMVPLTNAAGLCRGGGMSGSFMLPINKRGGKK